MSSLYCNVYARQFMSYGMQQVSVRSYLTSDHIPYMCQRPKGDMKRHAVMIFAYHKGSVLLIRRYQQEADATKMVGTATAWCNFSEYIEVQKIKQNAIVYLWVLI